MAASITKLTIAQFEQLELSEDRQWELHAGELIATEFPHLAIRRAEHQPMHMLDALLPGHQVILECPFQLAASDDARCADLGVLEHERAKRALTQNLLDSTPDLVVEFVSPSLRAQDLLAYRQLCFSNQTTVFWVVYPWAPEIQVYRKGEKTASIFELNDSIPISLLGVEASIPVRDIFVGITLS